jgi:beta-phosphoglucomutase
MSSDAVIFDMDGVLIDTYQDHLESWRQTAREKGLTLSDHDFARTFGCTSREVIAMLWGSAVAEEDIAAFDFQKEELFRRMIAESMPTMPGAMALLEQLRRAGLRLALGSSAPPESVDLVVERMGLGRFLDATVTGRDVTHGKPDPQVFLLAAQRMDMVPARCVVIEDAPVGIAAARAAGMAAVGVASTGRTRESLAHADLVVDRLDELSPERLRGVIARGTRRVPSH